MFALASLILHGQHHNSIHNAFIQVHLKESSTFRFLLPVAVIYIFVKTLVEKLGSEVSLYMSKMPNVTYIQ